VQCTDSKFFLLSGNSEKIRINFHVLHTELLKLGLGDKDGLTEVVVKLC